MTERWTPPDSGPEPLPQGQATPPSTNESSVGQPDPWAPPAAGAIAQPPGYPVPAAHVDPWGAPAAGVSAQSTAQPWGQQPAQEAPPTSWDPAAGWGAQVPTTYPRLSPYDEPVPYHRILRTHSYRWWKPALGLFVFIMAFFTLGFIGLFIPLELAGVSFEEGIEDAGTTPASLLSLNLSLAAAIPAAFLAMLVHRLKPGWLGSIAPRLRWRLFLPFIGLALLTAIGSTIAIGFIPVDEGTVAEAPDLVSFDKWAMLFLVVLLTTPLQAAGEEYAFRGVFTQALGAWVRNPWFAAVVTGVLFAMAHGGQNPALFTDRLVFGLVASYTVIRTGGLEAAIAMHAINNVVVFTIAAAFGEVEESLEVTDAPWSLVLVDVVFLVLFAVLVDRYSRGKKMSNVTTAQPPLPGGAGLDGLQVAR